MPVAQSKKTINRWHEKFSDLFQKTGFDISCKQSPKEAVCMNVKPFFLLKKKISNIIKLLSIEFTLSVVKVKLETISYWFGARAIQTHYCQTLLKPVSQWYGIFPPASCIKGHSPIRWIISLWSAWYTVLKAGKHQKPCFYCNWTYVLSCSSKLAY